MSDLIIQSLQIKKAKFFNNHISYDDSSYIILGNVPIRIKLPDGNEFYFGGTEEVTEKARNDAWKQTLALLSKFFPL